MSIQHMVASIDDLITYEEGEGFFYKADFRLKVIWIILTVISAVICLDMLFAFYLLFCTLLLEKAGKSPVFSKIRRNKALVTFTFGLILITFIFSSFNRALMQQVLTPVDVFFLLSRAFALGFIAVTVGTLFMSILQTTQTIEMTAGRGPTVSILTFLTFRSVPLVTYHLSNVIDSQRARGLEMEKIGLRTILRSIKAIIIPLFILLTGSVDRTSKVLEARGINPRVKHKTSYIQTKFSLRDFLLSFYILFQLIFSIWLASIFSPFYPTTTLTYNIFSNWGLV